MTLTPLGELRKTQAIAVYDWFRRRLVLILVAAMLVLQFLTWRAVERITGYLPSPPDCDYQRPCRVQGVVTLDEDTIRRLQR
jgi:hypothetical protein